MSHIFCIHSFVDGHIACLYVQAIVNSAEMTLGCMYLLKLWFYRDIWPRVGLMDHMVALYRASPSLAAKNIISLISVLTMW